MIEKVIEQTCFGLYAGNNTCQACPVRRQCKSTFISHGIDLLEGFIEELTAGLPEGEYNDSDRIQDLVDQLIEQKPMRIVAPRPGATNTPARPTIRNIGTTNVRPGTMKVEDV